MKDVKEISRICDGKYCLVINYVQHNKRPMFVYYSSVGYFYLVVLHASKILSEICSTYVFA